MTTNDKIHVHFSGLHYLISRMNHICISKRLVLQFVCDIVFSCQINIQITNFLTGCTCLVYWVNLYLKVRFLRKILIKQACDHQSQNFALMVFRKQCIDTGHKLCSRIIAGIYRKLGYFFLLCFDKKQFIHCVGQPIECFGRSVH